MIPLKQLFEDNKKAKKFFRYYQLTVSSLIGLPDDWIFTKKRAGEFAFRRSVLFYILLSDYGIRQSDIKGLMGWSRVTIGNCKHVVDEKLLYDYLEIFRELIKLCLISWENKEMASFNQVTLIGNVGKEPELFTFDSGGQIAKFSLAVADPYMDNMGEWKDRTDWFNVIVQGKRIESVMEKIHKGMLVLVNGKIKIREYETKEGYKKNSVDVQAWTVKHLPKPDKKDSDIEPNTEPTISNEEAPYNGPSEEDVPF